ncbi:hypothetical protein BKA93DRAFT_721934 [Sparassis latifolia]
MATSAAILTLWLRLCVLQFLCGLCARVRAYIPAIPTNSTALVGSGGNTSSHLDLQWYPMASYSEQVSYQLVGAGSSGVSKGALVHFSETNLTTNDFTTTPWIALVSCDGNATNASQEADIFTLANQRGAVSALLYSLQSQSCTINPDYADPANFNQIMDIFTMESLATANAIEDQFNAINNTKYYYFNSTLLNESFSAINDTIATGDVGSEGYVFATLIAYNATDPAPSDGQGQKSFSSSSSGGGANTSLAMIILYAITGCVSALFCVVIASGAVRAIRHPERYGPRAGDAPGFGAAQSRARGLTRAILDTFPVVKFGSSGHEENVRPKDVESSPVDQPTAEEAEDLAHDAMPGEFALQAWEVVDGEWRLSSQGRKSTDEEGESSVHGHSGGTMEDAEGEEDVTTPGASASASDHLTPLPRPRPRVLTRASTSGRAEKEVVPDAIGRETCPICIVDFEDGDDLRVLPCEGHHRFHRECVDQWLLELSSSCPICRQDFHALETMMARDDEHLELPHMFGSARPLSTAAARFSRYLRIARRRQVRERDDGHGYDVTDPPMPLASEARV